MKITGAGYIVSEAPHIAVHEHIREYEFHLFTRADRLLFNDDREMRIGDGSLVFSFPRTRHGTGAEIGAKELRFYYIRFVPEKKIRILLYGLSSQLPVYQPYSSGDRFTPLFEEIRRRTEESSPYSRLMAEHLLTAFIYELAADFHKGDRLLRHLSVQHVINLMQDSIYGELSLEQCAATAHLEKAYLIRLFHRETGLSPMQYYRRLKMQVASHLLRRSSESVRSIGQKLGFWDEFHFSKVFKKHFGKSPSLFRTKTTNSG